MQPILICTVLLIYLLIQYKEGIQLRLLFIPSFIFLFLSKFPNVSLFLSIYTRKTSLGIDKSFVLMIKNENWWLILYIDFKLCWVNIVSFTGWGELGRIPSFINFFVTGNRLYETYFNCAIHLLFIWSKSSMHNPRQDGLRVVWSGGTSEHVAASHRFVILRSWIDIYNLILMMIRSVH